jgi:hypothetical protein
LERTGHRPAAVARYIQMVKALPAGPNTVDVYERLAEIYLSAGEHKAVQTLLSRVLLFDPNREKARRLMAAACGQLPTLTSAPAATPATSEQAVLPVPVSLPSGQSAQPTGQTAGASLASERAPAPAPLRLPGGRGAQPTGQASPGAVQPLVLPRAGTAGAESPGRVTITVMKKAVDRLRQLPLFAELSLDELRALEALGEQCEIPAGTVLIEQGQEGSHLFVVLSGKVGVSHIGTRGETLLAELGQGAAVGEMALVDEGPTSARVLVVEDAVVYRWPTDRLRRHLATNEGTAHRILRVISRTLSVRLRETNRRAAGES